MASPAIRRATAELLWAAASPFPDADAISRAAGADVDAGLFANAAIEQWVGPLVWRGLALANRQESLGGAGERLRANVARWHAMAHYYPEALTAVLTALGEAGRLPLVLKGGALAERYGARGLRTMSDIDIVLPSEQHSEAIGVLERAGWTVIAPVNGLHYHTTLAHADFPTLTLELHLGLESWHHRETRLETTQLWNRRRPTSLFGAEAFGLTPEDELLVLAIHAGKPFHCFDRMTWFADLAVVIAAAGAAGGVDWELVRRRARRQRCTTVLSVALAQATRLGAVAPPDLLASVPTHGWRGTLIAPMLGVEWPLSKPSQTTRRRSRYVLSETWGRRALLFVAETPHEPLRKQPGIIGRRALMAAGGLRRIQRQNIG